MGALIEDSKRCTHCGLCQSNCKFLSKYGIDIGDTEKLNELAYHCFLCGECTRVCPIDIDGRGVILEMRQENANDSEGNLKLRQKYKGMLSEKADYKFRNYRRSTEGVVYFPGCNFPSLYPKTSEYISKLFKNEHGIGTVYDCCGKPVGELGLKEEEARIIDDMNKRFAEHGITEIVTACPNCKDYLTGKINIPITDIYTKLKELGHGAEIEQDVTVYLPCPDRGDKSWLEAASNFIKGEVSLVEGVNCCGLGGMARVDEPEIAKEFCDTLREEYKESEIYTYCASCIGNFTRSGKPAKHLLPIILGTNESPDTTKSYINRMMTKHKK